MRHLFLAMVLWFLGSSLSAKPRPAPDLTQSRNPLPLAASVATSLIPRTFSGIYSYTQHNNIEVTIIVVPLRETNHYYASWHYNGLACYTSTIRRIGPWVAKEHWRGLESGQGQGDWIVGHNAAVVYGNTAKRTK